MNNLPASVTNSQGWTFAWLIDDKEQMNVESLTNQNKPDDNLIHKVDFIWSEKAKEKCEGKDRSLLLRAELKILQDSGFADFTACKRSKNGKEDIYIVFGKTELRNGAMINGLGFTMIGFMLATSGFGLFSSIVLGAGKHMLFDAYKKDEYDFDLNEYNKQTIIGAVTGGLFGGIGNLFRETSSYAKTCGLSLMHAVGYGANQVLKGKKITVMGMVFSATAGVAPFMGSYSKMAVIATKIAKDDNLLLLGAFAEGATSSATSQAILNIANEKPVTDDIFSSGLLGGLTSVAYSLPEIEKRNEGVNTNTSKVALDVPENLRKKVEAFIEQRGTVLINNKWEKFEKNVDANHWASEIFNRVANGEIIVFQNGVQCKLCRNGICNITNMLNEHYGFWDYETQAWGKPPSQDIPNHIARINNWLSNGWPIYLRKGWEVFIIMDQKPPQITSMPKMPNNNSSVILHQALAMPSTTIKKNELEIERKSLQRPEPSTAHVDNKDSDFEKFSPIQDQSTDHSANNHYSLNNNNAKYNATRREEIRTNILKLLQKQESKIRDEIENTRKNTENIKKILSSQGFKNKTRTLLREKKNNFDENLVILELKLQEILRQIQKT